MAETKRGRKSQSNYRELVSKAITLLDDCLSLDDFPVLSQLPAIEQWVSTHNGVFLPRGKQLKTLLLQAIDDVIDRIGTTDDVQLGRIVEYLRMRYRQGVSVKAIAERWRCSTVHVWRLAGNRALDLVTDRFLELARSTEENAQPVRLGIRPIDASKLGAN